MKNILIIIFSLILLLPNINISSSFAIENNFFESKIDDLSIGDGKTDYYALLIGVDFNEKNGFLTIPFDENVEEMHDVLSVSSFWKTDHIKVLTNENVTKNSIKNGFKWLDKMDDGDDISFIYYTGHGNYFHLSLPKLDIKIPFDFPPFDEKDRCDEYITTWKTSLQNPFDIITDDLFNSLLDSLDSKGTAVLFDCCYSGGMIDSDANNIVMMSCASEKEEGKGIDFARYFMLGLQGSADKNNDYTISAEESFEYAKTLYMKKINDECHPQIVDRYKGELVLSELNLPPEIPILDGPEKSVVNKKCVYNVSTIDPDDDQIYYWIEWGDGTSSGWLGPYGSGKIVQFDHTWIKEGIYDIKVKAKDEYGAKKIPFGVNRLWSEIIPTIVHSREENIDQYQAYNIGKMYVGTPLAQSFIPSTDNITKIKLKLYYYTNGGKYNTTLAFREELYGENIAKIEKTIETNEESGIKKTWIEFVPEKKIEVNPGSSYYLVLERGDYNLQSLSWCYSRPDKYPYGTGYWYPSEWKVDDRDYCFVIYE